MKYHKSFQVIRLLLVAGFLVLQSTVGLTDDKAGNGEVAKVAEFTGEILPVFYVSDSRKSLTFYQNLGFRVDNFYDYDAGEEVGTWQKESPPIYAQMDAGGQKFALHLIPENDSLKVDGMKHYFGVSDVDAHHKLVVDNGISASKIYDRPWMRMFYVEDPDGHIIFFFTRPDSSD